MSNISSNIKFNYQIVAADFLASLETYNQFSWEVLRQAAFVGRSNVGKSSLINALCQRKGLARTSKTPGRTQALNFFKLHIKEESSEGHARSHHVYFVDLPGYGYAQVSKVERAKWPLMVESYMSGTVGISLMVLLIDCRREPREEEQYLAKRAGKNNLVIVLTKCDKLSSSQLAKSKQQVSKKLGLSLSNIFACSLLKGKGLGMLELRETLIDRILKLV